MPTQPTFAEMIQDAMLSLGDGKKGSSRQSIWKCIQTKYPERDSKNDYRLFIVRLKKLSENPSSQIIRASSQRFALSDKIRARIVRNKKAGKDITIKILNTEATTKPKAMKAKSVKAKKEKAKQQKKEKSEKKKEQSKAAKNTNDSESVNQDMKGKKNASAAKARDTKSKMQQKAKDNKKTKGSKDVQEKVSKKKEVQDKKKEATKKMNQNAAKKEKASEKKAASKR